MGRFMRRIQRGVAVTLFLLNFTGARAIAVSNTCDRCRVVYGPSASFKAMIKAVTGQETKKSSSKTLGLAHSHSHSQELESVQRRSTAAPVAASPAAPVKVALKAVRPGSVSFVKLPSDQTPVQPPHLHSKK